MDIRERITSLLEHWFIKEPLLFQILCSHELVENSSMTCAVRCGKRTLEYNPGILREMSEDAFNDSFHTEAVRILLKHPYERKPDGCCNVAVSLGSNIVIGDNYDYYTLRIEKPSDFDLEKNMPYEWYSRKIQSLLPPSDDDGDTATNESSNSQFGDMDKYRELSQLWEDDSMTVSVIDGIIDGCSNWGSLPGDLIEKLKASTKAKIDWRNVFNGFRTSILTNKRKLTRMRPNRRSGFEQMGSIREFTTKLLVAVDVSGSISSENLSYFYGVINSAFKYGFEAVDVIQFDNGITAVQNLRKATRDVTAIGRGGTSFQEPVNYAHENGYDGLVILTDGYAPEPNIPKYMTCNILWVCQDQDCYHNHHEWMEKSGRVCTMELK